MRRNLTIFAAVLALLFVGAGCSDGQTLGKSLYNPTSPGSFTLGQIGDVTAPSPNNNDILQYDTATSKWVAGSASLAGGINAVVDDTTPQLGGNLDLNGHVITSMVIGTDIQAFDVDLASIAGLTATDSNIIVGDGTGWVAESGATARTSLGVGTGDSPQFTGIELGHGTDTTITRASAGQVNIEGVQACTISNSVTLTNKTIDGDDNTLQDIGTGSLKTKTGADASVVTGTAGTNGNFCSWNGDGDAVDSGFAASSFATVATLANYQPIDATLTSLSALGTAADRMAYTTGVDTWAEAVLTSFGRSLLDDADAATAATTLGLGTGDSPQFTAIELGHASDTTLARVSAGVMSIEGVNALTVAGGTLTGPIDLGENAGIALDATLSADGKYSGMIDTVTAGATIAFGDVVYFKAADSEWYLTDADANATAGAVMVGMAVSAGTDGNTFNIMRCGKVREDDWAWGTIGAPMFIDATTAGDLSLIAPSGSADIVRITGYVITADAVWFCPDSTWIEIS